MASLGTVLRLKPTHANAYTNLAGHVRQENRLDEAIHLNRVAVSVEPRHATAYSNLGRALQADSALSMAYIRAALNSCGSRYALLLPQAYFKRKTGLPTLCTLSTVGQPH